MYEKQISKVLSRNDTGETGGHQAGLLIPKTEHILSFFPPLEKYKLNPRHHIQFVDDSGRYWDFAFIYYNNGLFGGTRNEYRLTRMTKYFRENGLKLGDEIILNRDSKGRFSVSYQRSKEKPEFINLAGKNVIKLGSNWKVIKI